MSCLRATQMRAVAMLLRLAAAVALLAPARAACLWNPHCMYCRARQTGSKVLDYLPKDEFTRLPQALLDGAEVHRLHDDLGVKGDAHLQRIEGREEGGGRRKRNGDRESERVAARERKRGEKEKDGERVERESECTRACASG